MQTVLESPAFIQPQAKIVDSIGKCTQLIEQVRKPFEQIRTQMQTFRVIISNAIAPYADSLQQISENFAQIAEFINSYNKADEELKAIEKGVFATLETDWKSSQMIEQVSLQIRCLERIVLEVNKGETIAEKMLCEVEAIDDTVAMAELNDRIDALNDAKTQAQELIEKKRDLLAFLTKCQVKEVVTQYTYDHQYVSSLYEMCEDSVLQGVQLWEFQMCACSGNYCHIKNRIESNRAMYYLLYLISKIKQKVSVKERKIWCIEATKSIGYAPTDTTKWRGNLSEKWLAQVDRIK